MSNQDIPLTSVVNPLDLLCLSLGENVYIKLKGDREVKGRLHFFDQHTNMILSDVEEIHTIVEFNQETLEEIVNQKKRKFEVLFVRGDSVIMVAPPVRT